MRAALTAELISAAVSFELILSPTSAFPPVLSPATPTYADGQISEMQDVVSEGRYASVFGGLVGDPAIHVVTIYLAPSADPAILFAARAALSVVGTTADPKVNYLPKAWALSFQTAGPSLAVLEGALSRVTSAEPWNSDVHGSLVGYGVDPPSHAVRIDVTAITPQILLDARSTFGDLAILDVMAPPHLTGSTGQQLYDGKPYYGGDALWDVGSYIHCTSGFAAYNPSTGTRGMLTAGHCYGVNGNVYQGTGQGTTGILGKVTIQSYGNNVVDAEFVDASTMGTTVDPDVNTSTPQGDNVSTTGTSFVGLNPCFDGAVSGENCYGTVQQADYCLVIGSLNICHVTKVTESNSNPVLCQSGDSGGPVYKYPAGLTAYGLIEATTDGYTCWYSEIWAAASQLGTPLLTVALHIPPPSPLGDTLQPNQLLNPDQYLSSSNPTLYGVRVYKYFLNMQGTDGNLVLYGPSGALWATYTQGNPRAYAVMQGPDGNFVVYRQGGIAIWNSQTQGNPNAYLAMQGDGNVVIYRQGGVAIWASNTCCYPA